MRGGQAGRQGSLGLALPVAAAGLAAIGVAFLPTSSHAQPVSKAAFVDGGSFPLPPRGGSGSLDRPTAIAWAPTDQVHVADERGTVSVFRTDGSLVRTYGTDEVRRIGGLAVDAAGRAYVLDTDQRIVAVFDDGGRVVHRIGSRGQNPGQLDDPQDVAVGPAGLVYVLDRGRRGVQVFSLDGTFLHDILLPADSRQPRALALSPSGAVFVADRDWNEALIRLPDLTAALNFPDAPAPTVGRLPLRGANVRDPAAVVATPTGTVIVADQESGILWSADGAGGPPVGSDDRLYGGRGSGRGSFRRLADASLAGEDGLVLLDRDERKVERVRLVLEPDRAREPLQDYPVRFQAVQPDLPPGVIASAPTSRGTAWYAVAEAQGRNIRVVEAELRQGTGVFGERLRLPTPSAGEARAFGEQVERAGGAALNDTLLVVTEPRRNRFHVFDLRTGRSIGAFGDGYRDDRRLRSPRGVALFPDGRIAVADNGNDRVVVFSADVATLLGTYPVPGVLGVAVSRQGRVFAWDESGGTAGEIPLEGGPIRPLPPSVPGGPVGALATDAVGNLYALRAQSGRVAIAGAALDRVVARLGGSGGLAGDQLAVDVDGNIYVTDMERARTSALRWGVEVSPVEGVTAHWGPHSTLLRWTPIPGSFVTGYEIEGSLAPEGPWAPVMSSQGAEARVTGTTNGWLRVAARTLTGALGRPSQGVPSLHLASGAAFEAGDWDGARRLGFEALGLIASRAVAADPGVVESLTWRGFLAAHQAGDHRDALEWNARLAGGVPPAERFQHSFRLADIHRHLGDLPSATDAAVRALSLTTDPPPSSLLEQVRALRTQVFEDGSTLRRWEDVAAVGAALLEAHEGPAPPDFVVRLAQATLRIGEAERALELARTGLDLASAQGQRVLATLSVIAAAQMGDWNAAREHAALVGDSVPGGLFAEFSAAMTALKLAEGDAAGAREELMGFLFQEEADILALADPAIATTALDVYAELIASGDAEGGRLLLDRLVAAIPDDLSHVREELVQRADSAAAVADTRAKLGRGFQLFRDALFRDALRFFQEADARTDLDVDQRLIVKEILAAVFYSLGRRDDADNAFRGVFRVDPDFVLVDHLARVQATYDLVIFSPEMLDHFRTVGPIM